MDIRADGLYSLGELAGLMGVSVRTLQRAIRRGELRVRRLGRKAFVMGSDVIYGLPFGGPVGGQGGGPDEGPSAEDVAF